MISFYMLRHGQTVANAMGYLSGSLDTPLTSLGRQQAAALPQLLPHLPLQPSLVIHSPLSRSRDTALLMNHQMRLPLLEMAEFAEQCFGDWQERLSWEKAKSLMGQGIMPPNGESREVFRARVMDGIAKIAAVKPAPDLPVLIVSHGGVFDALAEHYGCWLRDVENCQLYEFSPIPAPQPHAALTKALSCQPAQHDCNVVFPWHIHHHFLNAYNHPARHPVTVYGKGLDGCA